MRFPDLVRGREVIEQSLVALPMAALLADSEQRIVYLNPAFERTTGYALADLAGLNCRVIQGSGTERATVRAMRAALSSGRAFRGGVLNEKKTGEEFWNALIITPIRDETSAVIGYLSLHIDETRARDERRRDREQLETAELLLSAVPQLTAPNVHEVAQALSDAAVTAGADRAALAIAGDDGTFRIVSSHDDGSLDLWRLHIALDLIEADEGAERESPTWTDRLAAGSASRSVMDASDVERYVIVPVVTRAASRGALIAVRNRSPRSSSRSELVLERLVKLADLGGLALDNLDLIEQIRSVAERDQLTGVAARSVVQEQLEAALAAPSTDVSVVYLDVDRFKRINDSLGHAGGDALLSQVASRVQTAVGGLGVVGRPGGDEFVIVLPATDERTTLTVERRIAAAMRAPFIVSGRTVHASLSAGHAVGRAETGESCAAAAFRLLQAADAAMYVAKERKRVRPRLETELDVMQLEADLHRALELGEISTHFQPQYDGRDGRLAGFEALARWQHGSLGQIPPELFIPLAEETGVITALGHLVLRQAFQFADAAVARFGPFRLAVNLSKHELLHPDFVQQLGQLLDDHADRGWTLTLEVTEQEVSDDAGELRSIFQQLRHLGLDLAIDDFGTGFSSLKTLQELPISSIKIDETVLKRTGALGGGVIAAIVQLGLGLQLEVMAEGVESSEQLVALQQLGCGRVQGFLLAPPTPAAEALLAETSIALAIAATSRSAAGV